MILFAQVWLSPGKNSGAQAHNDGYCNGVFSVQLNGAKRWRLMTTPKMSSVFDTFDEFDGGIFRTKHLEWEPQYDFYNPEGGGVLFPPGYMHETRGQAECSTAFTFQVKHPVPTRYLRKFLPRLLLSQEVGHCYLDWDPFATWINNVRPSSDEETIAKNAKTLISLVDVNRDGIMSHDEVLSHFSSGSRTEFARDTNLPFDFGTDDLWASVDKTEEGQRLAKAFTLDAIAYHDEDRDGQVSAEEFTSGLKKSINCLQMFGKFSIF